MRNSGDRNGERQAGEERRGFEVPPRETVNARFLTIQGEYHLEDYKKFRLKNSDENVR